MLSVQVRITSPQAFETTLKVIFNPQTSLSHSQRDSSASLTQRTIMVGYSLRAAWIGELEYVVIWPQYWQELKGCKYF